MLSGVAAKSQNSKYDTKESEQMFYCHTSNSETWQHPKTERRKSRGNKVFKLRELLFKLRQCRPLRNNKVKVNDLKKQMSSNG
jgi:hypothetical protein